MRPMNGKIEARRAEAGQREPTHALGAMPPGPAAGDEIWNVASGGTPPEHSSSWHDVRFMQS